MAYSRPIMLPNGHTVYAENGVIGYGRSLAIAIPVSQLVGLTATEVGQMVYQALPYALEIDTQADEDAQPSCTKPQPPQSRTRWGYVYLLQAGPYYKIGASTNVKRRIRQLATLPPFNLHLLCTLHTDDMYGLEQGLHERFAAKRVNGEWFELDQEDVGYIQQLGEASK